MKQTKVENISIITNDGVSSPRFWNVSTLRLKVLFWGIPLFILLSATLTMYALYQKKLLDEELKEVISPKEFKELEEKYYQGINQIKENDQTIKELQEKLVSLNSQENLDTLSIFNFTKGIKDLTHTPTLTLENPKLTKTQLGVELNFNLVNISPSGNRAQGHLFILLRDKNKIFIWPENVFTEGTFQTLFSKGEYFATSRFRPVSADFRIENSNAEMLFKVLVFSTSGDLILKRLFSIKAE